MENIRKHCRSGSVCCLWYLLLVHGDRICAWEIARPTRCEIGRNCWIIKLTFRNNCIVGMQLFEIKETIEWVWPFFQFTMLNIMNPLLNQEDIWYCLRKNLINTQTFFFEIIYFDGFMSGHFIVLVLLLNLMIIVVMTAQAIT